MLEEGGMFAKANELARQFTRPVVVSVKYFDMSIGCGSGAFVVLNRDGWIATAAHVLEQAMLADSHSGELDKYNRQVAEVEANHSLNAQQKKSRISRLRTNPKWITKQSLWWGQNNLVLQDEKILAEADLAIGRLEPFDSSSVSHYPILKKPQNLMPGTSLCKLGFPFHEVHATFDETTQGFVLPPESTSFTFFPLEGIFTQNILAGRSADGKYEIKLLETSSPGLKGQSGGPIFDSHGTVWAIQTRTVSLPLDFNTKALRHGREEEVPQFLNVGVGVHPELLTEFLRDSGVAFEQSDY
jgi:hypothetical protein